MSKIRESFNLNHVITTFHHLVQGLRRADRVIPIPDGRWRRCACALPAMLRDKQDIIG
jgi:hypothetical protein